MTDPLTRHKQLMREMQRISDEADELEQDEAYQKALAFKKDIEEVLKKHGKTEEDLLQMLAPPTPQEPRKRSSRKPKQLPLKRFTNRHTGEWIDAKSIKDPELKPWIEEHGADEVKSWAKKIDDKNKPSHQS